MTQAGVVTAPQGRATVDVATVPPVRATVLQGRATVDVATEPPVRATADVTTVSQGRATVDVATAPQGRAVRKVVTECHIMQSDRCGHHEPHDRPTQMATEATVAT